MIVCMLKIAIGSAAACALESYAHRYFVLKLDFVFVYHRYTY